MLLPFTFWTIKCCIYFFSNFVVMFLLHFHPLNTACGINKVTHAHTNMHTNTHIPNMIHSSSFSLSFFSFSPPSLFCYCFLFLNCLFLPVSVCVFPLKLCCFLLLFFLFFLFLFQFQCCFLGCFLFFFFYGVGSCRGLVEVKAVRRQLGGGALSV